MGHYAARCMVAEAMAEEEALHSERRDGAPGTTGIGGVGGLADAAASPSELLLGSNFFLDIFAHMTRFFGFKVCACVRE